MKRSKSMFADLLHQSTLVDIKHAFCGIFICLSGALMMAVLFLMYLPLLVINPYKKFLKWLENTIASTMVTL